MGQGQGRAARAADDEAEVRYDARAGLYFGDHFVMGGQEFAALEPEAFLFGEMADLNYLSRMPGALNRHPPNIKHTNATRCLFFTNKETVRLVPHAANADGDRTDQAHLDFTFDADAPCSVTVHFFAKEEVDSNGVVQFKSKIQLETFHYEPGIGQSFAHPEATVAKLDQYKDDELFFQQGSDTYPLVIHIVADIEGPRQALATYATFERSNTGTLTTRPLVQKANVNGLCLVLKEIFGIEKKEPNREGSASPADDFGDDDEDNTECVVCMSQAKDTMALPCRHLCLCNPCADVLRFQANKCPICRAPFHSLLQIRVLKPEDEIQRDPDGLDDDEEEDNNADLPPGYKSISLAEAVVKSDTTSAASSPARAGHINGGYLQVASLHEDAASPSAAGPAADSAASSALVTPEPAGQEGYRTNKGKGPLVAGSAGGDAGLQEATMREGHADSSAVSSYEEAAAADPVAQAAATIREAKRAFGGGDSDGDGDGDDGSTGSGDLGKVKISDYPSDERLQMGGTTVHDSKEARKEGDGVGIPGSESFNLPGTPSAGATLQPQPTSPNGDVTPEEEERPLINEPATAGGALEI